MRYCYDSRPWVAASVLASTHGKIVKAKDHVQFDINFYSESFHICYADSLCCADCWSSTGEHSYISFFIIFFMFWWYFNLVCLFVFNIPSTARSFRDGTHIYCPLRRTWSSVNTPSRPGIEPGAVAWQFITLPLPHGCSTLKKMIVEKLLRQKITSSLISSSILNFFIITHVDSLWCPDW